MQSVGTKLREARTRKGYTLEDVNARTRISLKNLTALEADDLTKIASPFTYRAFVKQVAETVGVSYESLLTDVQTASSSMPEPLVPGQEDPAVVRPNQFPFPEQKRTFNTTWVYRTASIAAVAGLVSGYLLWRNNGIQAAKLPVPAPSLPSSSSIVSPASTASEPLASPAPPPPSPVNETPATVAPGTEQLLPPATQAAKLVSVKSVSESAEADDIRIELKATEPTWLSITTDGKTAFNGTLEATETKVFSGHDKARIKTANAGGVNIVFNGRALGTLGQRGQVRTFVFTKDGYEVVRGVGSVETTRPTPTGG